MIKGIRDLVNAQVSVNRAVFEANQETPRPEYLQACAVDAIVDLKKALKALKKLIPKKNSRAAVALNEGATTTVK